MIENFKLIIEFTAEILTIIASTIAVIVYIRNKDKISSSINFILNYSNQMTLNDLKYRIERLNDYTAMDNNQKIEIVNILSEIEGQISANKTIKRELSEQFDKICMFTSNPKLLTEPKKRSLVSELRECIRNIDVINQQKTIK